MNTLNPRDAGRVAAQNAAATLQVGVTTLKKICRKFHILRWPYCKRFSQNKLIERVTRHISEAAQPGGPADARAQSSSLQVGPGPWVGSELPTLFAHYSSPAKCGALQLSRHRPPVAAMLWWKMAIHRKAMR